MDDAAAARPARAPGCARPMMQEGLCRVQNPTPQTGQQLTISFAGKGIYSEIIEELYNLRFVPSSDQHPRGRWMRAMIQ
ncbi:hypothetical protein [Rhizobium subbaraonis]|uniref:hypothetical protein n=1 Tax=Rhizobium subbaraonis TaxID=908946 RepID=UPI001144468D|nr:hypothetical protein [Rhizobium subbaraonis]